MCHCGAFSIRFHRLYLQPYYVYPAQMAELVDASVSNTDNASCAGSTPALGTKAKAALRSGFLHV